MKLPRTLTAVLLTLIGGASSLCAQSYVLNNGTVLKASEVKLSGNALVQEIALPGGGSAERRYLLNTVARLSWPEPEEVGSAEAELAAGKNAEALATITPIYRIFGPFSKTPGSWWTQAASLRLQAMVASKASSSDISSAAREIMNSATDPEAVGNAKLALAQVDAREGRDSLASAMIDQIVNDAPSGVRARAWLLRGDLALKKQSFEAAIEAYLHVPAFFGTLDELMPSAILGSARAYKGYGDASRSERAYLDVIDTYPNTAEAQIAKNEAGF